MKISSTSFLSSSDIQKFHHLLGCHAIGINSSPIFFKYFAFLEVTTPRRKSDMNYSTGIIFIKTIIIIKIDKFYQDMQKEYIFDKQKNVTIIKIFIIKEYISNSV